MKIFRAVEANGHRDHRGDRGLYLEGEIMPMTLKEKRQRRQFGERAAANRAQAAAKRRPRQQLQLSKDAAHLLVAVPPLVLAAWMEVRP